jgi:hypothetical protein
LLRYSADVDVGGKLASVGGRLIGGVAASMAEEFFGKFSRAVAGGVGGDRLEAASQAAGAAALSPRAIAGHIPLIDRCAWLLVGVGIGVIATLGFLGRL